MHESEYSNNYAQPLMLAFVRPQCKRACIDWVNISIVLTLCQASDIYGLLRPLVASSRVLYRGRRQWIPVAVQLDAKRAVRLFQH